MTDAPEGRASPGALPDSRIKHRHLRCLVEIVRQGRLAAAAETLGITPSAASKTLIELEEIVGVRLVERSRAGVALTPAGEILHRHARASLSALRRGVDLVSRMGDASRSRVQVGVLPTVAAQLMPEAVERFKAALPHVPLRLVTGINRSLLVHLRAGEVDFVVGRLAEPEAMDGLDFRRLYVEGFAVVVRPNHPALSAGARAEAELAGFPVLLPPRGTVIRPEIDRFLIGRGLTDLPDIVETLSPEFSRAYLLRTNAVWLVPRGVVSGDLGRGALGELPIDMRSTGGPVGITTRSDTTLGPEAQSLLDHVRAAAEGRDGEPG